MRLWDLYDKNLEKTGNVVPSDSEVPDGYYHMSVEIWVINSKKEVLLLKNSIDYSRRYPGCYLAVCGNLLTDESYEDAVKRTIKEKIGLDISYEKIFMSEPIKRDPYRYAYVTYILKADVNMNEIKFEDGTIMNAKFVSKDKFKKMCNNGEVAYYMISRFNDEVVKYLD